MTSRLKVLHLSDFTGGLVTNRPASELEANQSPDMDNIIIDSAGFHSRQGDTAFCAAMNSGANVQGLYNFKTSGGTDYLIAVCGDKVYKSDSLDGTMDDVTGTLTIGAGQNNIWTFCSLNDLAIGVGGAPNAPFKYSGTGNAAALGGSPVSGKFCFQMKDRVFIGAPTAAPSTLYWSVLSNAEDWSGTGSGNTTIVTNDGDTLVGGIPLNNDLAILFKNYSIHQLIVQTSPFPVKPLAQGVGACGKNAIVYAEGLIYFLTNTPRMKATDGYQVIDFPDTLDDVFDTLTKSRLPYAYGVYYAKLRQIHWYVTGATGAANNLCIVWDLEKKCWLKFTTGFDCNVACIAQGWRLFGGHTNGIIYEKLVASTYTDASESAAIVSSYWYSPWFNDANNISVKQIRYFDVNFDTQTSGSIVTSYGYDFNKDLSTETTSILQTGTTWDGTGAWDTTAVWGGTGQKQMRMYVAGTRGNVMQIKLANSTANIMQINSISLAMKTQGAKDANIR